MNTRKRKSMPSLAACMGIAALAAAALFLVVQPASAQSCMQEVWTAHGNNQNLTCTANDVSLSSVTNICLVDAQGNVIKCEDGDPSTHDLTCNSGQQFYIAANFSMPLTAQARYDLGLYTSSDGDPNGDRALTGACTDNIITAANAVPASNFLQLDPSPDICGDINDTHNPQVFRQIIQLTCSDSDNNGQVNVPWCTSWRQPGSNEVCDSSTFTTAGTWDAFPGSPSKCNCGDLNIDVFFETASITVDKVVSPTTVPEIGGDVQYTVTVTNHAQVSSVQLNSLTDSIYHDITTTGHDGITATDCALVNIQAGNTPDADPATVNNPYVCSFTVHMGVGDAGQTVTDTVKACGSDQFGHTGDPNDPNSPLCDTGQATVTYTDTPITPGLVKDATATVAAVAQVDVNFTVTVTNNNPVNDTLTLQTLTDNKFGDITTVHAAGGGFAQVVSTNCGQSGLGDPGALPQDIPPNGTYICHFVGRIVTSGPYPFLHTDRVSGSGVDDDGGTHGDPPLGDDASVSISVNVSFP